MKRAILLLVASLLLGGVGRADEIRIEGGATTISSVFLTVKSLYEEATGGTVSVAPTTAVAGLIALAAGRVDAAAGAHPLEDLIAAAAKEGAAIDAAVLVATPIEESRLVAITHRTNPVKQLSREQLKAIFTGRITNWREVGGVDQEIEVVWGTETKGQNMQFSRVVLDGVPVAPGAREVNGYRSIVNLVCVLPRGIGIVPVGMSSPQVHLPEIPAITSPIYLITKGTPSARVQAFIDFHRKESEFLR